MKCDKRRTLRAPRHAALLLALAATASAAAPVASPDSAVGRPDSPAQRVLRSAFEPDSSVEKGGWRMQNLAAEPAASPPVPVSLEISSPAWIEPDTPLSALLTIVNRSPAPLPAEIEYTIRRRRVSIGRSRPTRPAV